MSDDRPSKIYASRTRTPIKKLMSMCTFFSLIGSHACNSRGSRLFVRRMYIRGEHVQRTCTGEHFAGERL